jgi:hypothetical protein
VSSVVPGEGHEGAIPTAKQRQPGCQVGTAGIVALRTVGRGYSRRRLRRSLAWSSAQQRRFRYQNVRTDPASHQASLKELGDGHAADAQGRLTHTVDVDR